jgi:hypothetical protein
VYGGKIHPVSLQSPDRPGHGFGYIEKLEISKHLLATLLEPANQAKVVTGHEKLQPHLIKSDGIAQIFHQGSGIIGVRHIQGHDEPVVTGNIERRQVMVHDGTAVISDKRAYYNVTSG